jgi:hypothetical protein
MSFRTILVPIEQHDLMNSTLEIAFFWRRSLTARSKGSLYAVRTQPPTQWPMRPLSL